MIPDISAPAPSGGRVFCWLSQSSSRAETTVDNRLPAVGRELELADPGGRREWSSDCKENRRGMKCCVSEPCRWQLFGLSGAAVARRKLTGSDGLRGETKGETLRCRGLTSTTLGLNSFLTRPPNRLTLLRNVRLPTEILAAYGECSCRSPCKCGSNISSPGGMG